MSQYSIETIRLLLKAGAQFRPAGTRPQIPLVGLVASDDGFDRRKARAIIQLLKDNGYDPCWTDADGETPYEIAITENKPEVADLLMSTGMSCK